MGERMDALRAVEHRKRATCITRGQAQASMEFIGGSLWHAVNLQVDRVPHMSIVYVGF